MSSPFSVRSLNDHLRSSMESSIYRNTVRLYNPSIALDNEIDAREMVARDASICGTMDQYCYDVAATGYQIVPGGKDPKSIALADRIQELFSFANVADATYEAAGYVYWGRAYCYLDGKRCLMSLGDNGLPRNYWVPTWIHDIDPNRVIFVPKRSRDQKTGRENLEVVRALWDVASGRYELMTPEFESALIEVKWGDTEDRFGYGRGLIDSIFFYWRAKAVAMRDGLQGLARWAKSIIVAKVDPDRPADTSLTNEALANDLLDKLTNQAQNGIIVIPKDGGEIEVHETSGSGHELVKWFIQYFDGEIARLILGSKMPTGAGEDGSAAGSEGKSRTQERTTSRRIMFHRNRIAECFSRTLIPIVVRQNYPLFAAEGLLPGAKMPRWKIVDEQFDDPMSTAELACKAQEAGADIPAEWFHEKTGIPMAKEGEAILKATPKNPSPFGGGGDPFGGGKGDGSFPGKNRPDEEGEESDNENQQQDGPPRKFRARPRHAPWEYVAAPAPQPIVVNVPAQPAAAQAPINVPVTVNVPEQPDITLERDKAKFFEAKYSEMSKRFSDAMERPVHVEVHPAQVNVPAPIVNVTVEPAEAPNIIVPAPIVNVEAPNVTVEAPPPAKVEVNVEAPKPDDRKVVFVRDKNGNITGAEKR